MVRRTWRRALDSLRPTVDDAPIVAAAATMTLPTILRRFWPRLRGLRGWLALSLVVLALVPLVQVVEILLFQRLVDDVLVPADAGPLLGLALLYVALNLASGVLAGVDDYLSTWISQRFLVDLRRDVFAHLLALPGHVHDRRRLGDTVARLTSDVGAVERFMVSHLAAGVSAVVSLLWYVAAMFWIQWELALASLVAAPLLWWVARGFGHLTRSVSRERRRRGGSLTSITEESLANVSMVQLYGREATAVAAYHRQNRAIAHAELAASRIRAVFQPLVDLVELMGVLGVVGLGVWALATGRLTLGELLAFLTLLTQCYRPLRQLGDLLPDLYSASAGVERLVELLDEPAATDRPGARALRPIGWSDRAARGRRGVRRRRPPGHRRARPARRRRGAGRDRGPQRRGQVHPRATALATPRPGQRAGPRRRPGSRGVHGPVRPRGRHGRLAGDAAARRHGRRGDPVRRPRGVAGRGRGGGPGGRRPRASSCGCPTATTRGSGSAAAPCRAVSVSGWPSPERCCGTLRCWSSTSRRPGSTPRPVDASSTPCSLVPGGVPCSSSPTTPSSSSGWTAWSSSVTSRRRRPGGGDMRTATDEVAPGTEVLPGYRVVRRLTHGRRLDTFDCLDEERGCRVVVKVLRPDRRAGRPRARGRAAGGATGHRARAPAPRARLRRLRRTAGDGPGDVDRGHPRPAGRAGSARPGRRRRCSASSSPRCSATCTTTTGCTST